MKQVILKYRHILIYATLMAVLVFILKWLQWKYIISDNSVDLYAGLIALIFTALGIWLATNLTKSRVKTVVVEKEVYLPPQEEHKINHLELAKLNLTTREHEVMELLVKGQSNAEIAEELCLSLSTIKTHVSNLLSKMEVKSRAQAIEKARRLRYTA